MTSASVIVPAALEEPLLESCLDALEQQSFDGPTEVIVVAAGDETVEVASDHTVVETVIEDSADGPGVARNEGAAAADGDVLCFTDADTVISTSWIDDHLRHYANGDVVGVGGPLRPLEDGLGHRLCFRLLSDWWYRASWPLGFVQQPGTNCSVRRSAFEAVGGFDESLAFLEDTDLSLRLNDEGLVVYDPSVPVRTSVRRQRDEGYARLWLSYARGYLEYALPGRQPSREYFE